MEQVRNVDELSEQTEAAARDYFRHGLNCAECVLKSFLELGMTDFPPEIVALASGFGGGIGYTRNTCGAALGGALAVGTMQGRKDPLARETVQERIAELNSEDGIYQIFRRYMEEIEARYGTVVCRELSQAYDWEGKPRKKNCQEIIGYCAALATKYALASSAKNP